MVIALAFLPLAVHAQGPLIPEPYKPGLTALTDLGTGTYQGHQGGLYPGGVNVIPAVHSAAGRLMADRILPRDAVGNVDLVNGKIVMLSIGLSNTEQVFENFIPLAEADPLVNGKIVFVNTAQGSMAVHEWANPLEPDYPIIWSTFDARLAAAGVTAAQVQVAWMKHTTVSGMIAPFPAGATQVNDWMRQTLQLAKARCPNLVAAYCTSRVYAGYANKNLNPEPDSYENGFSVKWLIEDQINGDPELAFDGPSPKAPWLCWGAYNWTNGLGPDLVEGGAGGRSDNLEWHLSDMAADGTHPSDPQGRNKQANLLLNWLKNEPTCVPWFVASLPAPPPQGDERGSSRGCGSSGSAGNALPMLLAMVILMAFSAARKLHRPSPALRARR